VLLRKQRRRRQQSRSL